MSRQKHIMKDLIILLPGIMGSVLKDQHETRWSMPSIIGPALAGKGERFNHLYLAEDDPERDVLADGIVATDVVRGIHGIHGLMLGEGYQRIIETITTQFKVIVGTPTTVEPVNFIPFPYDWRRDNRVAARQLQTLIERKLRQWREHITDTEKKTRVILIAHSMGGLVARYYLEALGGWEHCRALFTLGTPHRGSPKAVASLCTGHTLGRADLTNLVRSFTSAYQLLPIYPVIRINDQLYRLSEAANLPYLSPARVQAAFNFHHKIREGVVQRSPEYSQRIFPFVGTWRKTYQSMFLAQNAVEMSYNLPQELPPDADTEWLRTGDDTVPYISAIPIDLDMSYRDTCVSESHAWLPSNQKVLGDLCRLLVRMQLADHLQAYQGELLSPEAAQTPVLSMELESLYQQDTPIRPSVRIINAAADPGQVLVTLTADASGRQYEQILERSSTGWETELTHIPLGVYRVEVSTYRRGPQQPLPVHSILEVIA